MRELCFLGTSAGVPTRARNVSALAVFMDTPVTNGAKLIHPSG